MNEIPRKTRLAVIERDGGKCRACGTRTTEVHVRANVVQADMSQAFTACTECKRRFASNQKWAEGRGFLLDVASGSPNTPLWSVDGWHLLRADGAQTLLAPPTVRPEGLRSYLEALVE